MGRPSMIGCATHNRTLHSLMGWHAPDQAALPAEGTGFAEATLVPAMPAGQTGVVRFSTQGAAFLDGLAYTRSDRPASDRFEQATLESSTLDASVYRRPPDHNMIVCRPVGSTASLLIQFHNSLGSRSMRQGFTLSGSAAGGPNGQLMIQKQHN